MDKNPHIATAISRLGGPVAAARALQLTHYQTAQQWVRNGNVPAAYARRIEELTGISRSLLCRQWKAIWPDLPAAETLGGEGA
jgi:hypothetical protein